MHEVSTAFATELYNLHKKQWIIDVVPDAQIIPLLSVPTVAAVNYYTGHTADLYHADLRANTFFEPNTARNGTMYLMANADMSKALRSSDISKADCTYDNELKISFSLVLSDGSIYPYSKCGFSTACKNGDYATDFEIKYLWDGGSFTEQITGYTNGIYRIADNSNVNSFCNAIEVTIKKWCRPKSRAVISRVFFNGVPYQLTNDMITSSPRVFKELESQNEALGSVSANQTEFEFYNGLGLQAGDFSEGGEIKLRYGIKNNNVNELVPYGTYYIKSAKVNKKIVKITAQDNMAVITSSKLEKFHLNLSDRSYANYIDELFEAIGYPQKRVMSSEQVSTLGGNSASPKTLRDGKISDIFNEVTALTASCICFNDDGILTHYGRYENYDDPIVIPDELVSNISDNTRTVPDIILINRYPLEKLTDAVAVSTKLVYGLPYEAVGTSVVAIPITYTADGMAYNPTSDFSEDELYAKTAVIYRQCWEDEETPVGALGVINADATYGFGKTAAQFKRIFAPGKTEFYINSYIADVSEVAENTLSVFYGGMTYIRNWFVKTKCERTFEIPSDPRIELGDTLSVRGMKGTVYRIDLNGNKAKITIRGESFE